MFIHDDLCIGCGRCVPYCPVGAITLDEIAQIDAGFGLDLTTRLNPDGSVPTPF